MVDSIVIPTLLVGFLMLMSLAVASWIGENSAILVSAAATVVLVVAAVCLAFMGYKQLHEMRANSRAWLSVDPKVSGVSWDAGGLHFTMRYTLKNTGRSPAMEIHFDDYEAIVFGKEQHPIQWIADKRKVVPPGTGYPLFPNEPEQPIYVKHTIDRGSGAREPHSITS